jgi:hypothetical protein
VATRDHDHLIRRQRRREDAVGTHEPILGPEAKEDARAGFAMLGAPLEPGPQTSLVVLGIDVGRRSPATDATCPFDFVDDIFVAEEGRDHHDRRDRGGIALGNEQGADAAHGDP